MQDFAAGSTFSTNTTPVNMNSAPNAQFCVYSSIPSLTGHRVVYDNTTVSEEEFTIVNSTSRDKDQVGFIFEGC